jgi:hypothetical protein
MIFFSFSLYGLIDMYILGIVENIKIINSKFPNARIQIYIADDVTINIKNNISKLPNVKLIHVNNKEGIKNMFDRFEAIDDPECTIMFVRDADSRIHDRDVACIEDFINSNKLLHIIRDHKYHNTKILGGLWGIRKEGLKEPITNIIQQWIQHKKNFHKGIDQEFLAEKIYPILKSNSLIHDRYRLYEPSNLLSPFRVEIKNKLFCGQVHRYDLDGNEYTEFDP